MQMGTGTPATPLPQNASFATFTRRNATTQVGPASYIKIPWTPKLADPLAVTVLTLSVRGLTTPKPATWYEETLHPSSEAYRAPCTARATMYCASGLAAFIAAQVANYASDRPTRDEMTVDFRNGIII